MSKSVSSILEQLVMRKNANQSVGRVAIAKTIMHEFLIFYDFVSEEPIDTYDTTILGSRYKYLHRPEFSFLITYVPDAMDETYILMKVCFMIVRIFF